MRPIIGITPMYDCYERKSFVKFGYQEAIEEAGGLPFLLPVSMNEDVLNQTFNCIDGLVLSGGPDIDPENFNQETYNETGEISPTRDKIEIYLSKKAIENNKPILGICRGCQILNISAGGNIFQDIYTKNINRLKHCQDAPKWYPTHSIQINENSIHYKMFKTKNIRVNSFHHQAVKELGKGFFAAAWSSDDIIEAIEHEFCKFCVGVQYHPELLWEKDESFLKLFIQLVSTAKDSKS